MAAPFFFFFGGGGVEQVVHEHMARCESSVAARQLQTRKSLLKHFLAAFVSRRSAVIGPFCFGIVTLKKCFHCGPLQKKATYSTSITPNSS